jgi:hypothetical protein
MVLQAKLDLDHQVQMEIIMVGGMIQRAYY